MLYNQRDAMYTIFFIVISALHVSGGFSARHQELIKLYVQPWVLSSFPAVYRWCGWVGTQAQEYILTRKQTCKDTFRPSDLYLRYFVTVRSVLEISQEQQIGNINKLLSDM